MINNTWRSDHHMVARGSWTWSLNFIMTVVARIEVAKMFRDGEGDERIKDAAEGHQGKEELRSRAS